MSPNSQSTTDYLRQEWARRSKERDAAIERHRPLHDEMLAASRVVREALREGSATREIEAFQVAAADASQALWEVRNASRREWLAYCRYSVYSRSGYDLAEVEA
jgi:hypothetical protein